jgi:phosphoribosylanthranilate isomerase
MIVKICGITNREDALAAAGSGASALGFNFYPASPRYVPPETAVSIAEGLPPGVWKVGVFVNEPAGAVARVASEVGLDVVQMHGDGEFPPGFRVWKALRVGPQFRLRDLDTWEAEAFLLDTASDTLHGGTGMTFDWTVARGAAKRVVLAGGLDAGNVRRAIEEARPWGVDACSRLESSPGRKDHAKMARFIEAALS